jgi:surface antigen
LHNAQALVGSKLEGDTIINNPTDKRKLYKNIGLVLTAAIVTASATAPAWASSIDDSIKQLNGSIAASSSQINALNQQKNTLQNRIAMMNAQIDAINQQISISADKAEKLKAEIQATESKIEAEKAIQNASLRALYQDSNISALEMLASSKNFSAFVDKQQYRDSIKDKAQAAVEETKKLKQSLTDQQQALDNDIASQKAQQLALQNMQQQQSQLLADTQNQEEAYQSKVAADNQQLQQLYAQRAAADAQSHVQVSTAAPRSTAGKGNVGTVAGGSYPYANLSPDSQVDPWGFYVRECVSYVAWKRRAENRSPFPNYWGNAANWVNAAATTGSPSAGAIAVYGAGVQSAGSVGHVAYVESVNANGTINVSEYNWKPYEYTYRTSVPTTGLRFIP